MQPGDYVAVETQPANLVDVSENEGGADDDKPDNGVVNSIAGTVSPNEEDVNNDFIEEEQLGSWTGNVSKDTNNDGVGVPEGTHLEAMEAGEFVSASGVYCEARGSSSTNDSHDENCYYEAPSDDYPRGRVIWKGVVSSDPGKHTEDEAENEVVIRFVTVLENPNLANQEIHNQGDSEWDYDNDGTPDTQVKTQAPTEDGGETVFKPVNAIPTLSEWMLMLLALLLLVSGKRESMKLTGRKF